MSKRDKTIIEAARLEIARSAIVNVDVLVAMLMREIDAVESTAYDRLLRMSLREIRSMNGAALSVVDGDEMALTEDLAIVVYSKEVSHV